MHRVFARDDRMAFSSDFESLLRRVDRGDQAATDEFGRDYSHHVLRIIRRQLENSKLKRQMDADDIVQSILGCFLVAARQHGQKWEHAKDVLHYLVAMARNELSNHERHCWRETARSECCSDASLQDMASDGRHPEIGRPGDAMQQHEEMNKVHQQMSDAEWTLACARSTGKSWREIAAASGEKKETIRKRFNRTLKRVRRYFRDRE
jgi:RNA polymerase sigma factor (sigma-70 family)